jgi:hypothetical protein
MSTLFAIVVVSVVRSVTAITAGILVGKTFCPVVIFKTHIP